MPRPSPKLPIPDFKLLKPMTELDGIINQMKKAKQDTMELEKASKELNTASAKLSNAYKETHKVAHKEQTLLPGPLDVSKTPSSGGPVPIPYPNIAKSRKATDGKIKVIKKAEAAHNKATQKVKMILDKKVAVMKKELSTSSGDEAGTLKGIISSTNKGKAKMTSSFSKVKVEGKKFLSHIDLTRKNGEKQIKIIEKKSK